MFSECIKQIDGETIAATWEASLRLFPSLGPHRYDNESMGLTCLEVEDCTLAISHPHTQPVVSKRFPDADFWVKQFVGKLTDLDFPDASVSRRLFSWPNHDGDPIDQLQSAIDLLRDAPGTRRAILGFWNPTFDLNAGIPVSPCLAYLRVRTGRLFLSVVARSVDAWNGAVPILVAFARLQERVSNELGVERGPLIFTALSYHLYETDVPHIAQEFEWGKTINGT